MKKSHLLGAVCASISLLITASVFANHVDPNTNPVADAGADIIVFENESFMLDGSGSFDPDGDSLLYS